MSRPFSPFEVPTTEQQGPQVPGFRSFGARPLGLGAGAIVMGGLLCLLIGACNLDEALPNSWVLQKHSLRRLEQAANGEAAGEPVDAKAAQKAVQAALDGLFGSALEPRWPFTSPDAGLGALVEAAETYRNECSHCHGLEGYGNGPSSQFLNPKPWNFSLGVFPRSAPTGGEPHLPDLVRILQQGLPASSMPSFARLGEKRLRGVSGHVLLLLQRSRMETLLVDSYLEKGAAGLSAEAAQELWLAMQQDSANGMQLPTKTQNKGAPEGSDSESQ